MQLKNKFPICHSTNIRLFPPLIPLIKLLQDILKSTSSAVRDDSQVVALTLLPRKFTINEVFFFCLNYALHKNVTTF